MTTQLLPKLYKASGGDNTAVVYATNSEEAIRLCEVEADFTPAVVELVPLEHGVILVDHP